MRRKGRPLSAAKTLNARKSTNDLAVAESTGIFASPTLDTAALPYRKANFNERTAAFTPSETLPAATTAASPPTSRIASLQKWLKDKTASPPQKDPFQCYESESSVSEHESTSAENLDDEESVAKASNRQHQIDGDVDNLVESLNVFSLDDCIHEDAVTGQDLNNETLHNRVQVGIAFPPGRLGLTFESVGMDIKVREISRFCPRKNEVKIGDILRNWSVSGRNIQELQQKAATRAHRTLWFQRSVVRTETAAAPKRTGRPGRKKSSSSISSENPPTLLDIGAHADAMAQLVEKTTDRFRKQHVGAFATKFSDLKGRAAEAAKSLLYKSLFEFGRMVTFERNRNCSSHTLRNEYTIE